MELSTQRASTSLPSTESPPRWKYDVFLSFRGADTRKDFVSHLYHELQYWQAIKTFKDDRELEVGDSISPKLLNAIEASHLAIVVLSPNYASSTWCLEELATILESMETRDNTILPIFFQVDPCDVRYQRKNFAQAFAKHEERFSDDTEKLKRWRAALRKVAGLSGLDSKNYGCERELINVIVKCVWSKVRPRITLSDSKEKLVGIDSRLVELGYLLAPEANDVRFIGICGMGGMGKTTLAKLVFERISHHFEVSNFLFNVREVSTKHGSLVDLQKQLLFSILKENVTQVWDEQQGTLFIRKCLFNKKVLLVLDDIDRYNQLEILAGNRSWFGDGSRIIITTRDERMLIEHDIERSFKVEGLNASTALVLFSHNAFRKDEPEEGFSKLSKCFVDYAKGLPLALKVLGRSLYRRGQDEWISALDELKESPDTEIFSSLKISYDGLRVMCQNIFLDVAFFHKGKDKKQVIEILDRTYDFSSLFGINVLIEKSLLIIERGNKVGMHDLIQEMAWEIVHRESREPGFRSRLCHRSDIFHVFVGNKGTDAIRGIRLCLPKLEEADSSWNCESLSKMFKLTFLELNNLIIYSGPKFLPDSLRNLIWSWYPSRFLPGSYRPNLLIELKMKNSQLVRLWDGKQDLPYLKSIDLRDSKNLTKTPDLTGIPNLEVLQLTQCTGLVEIHPSIAVHKKLKILSLLGCKSIKSFPKEIEMDSLVRFSLRGCSKIQIPEFARGMKNLSYLDLSGTAIEEIPSSIEHLVGLVTLQLMGCKSLTCVPSAIICKLKSLKRLVISGCSKLEKVIENMEEMECLEELSICETAIRELPFLLHMKNLKMLFFRGSPVIRKHGMGFGRLLGRKSPEPLRMVLPSLRTLCSLETLNLSDHNLCEGDIPDDIGYLSSLQCLFLSGNNFVSLPASIQCLSMLRSIDLKRCKRLQQLPDLPSNRVLAVRVDNCASLKQLSEPSKLNKPTNLEDFRFSSVNCFGLADDEGLNNTIFSMLRRMATQRISLQFDEFRILTPGSKIPKWFNIQSEDDSLTVELPSDQNSMSMGIMFCVVFSDHENPTALEFDYFGIQCLSEGLSPPSWNLGKRGQIMRDHLWIFYMPHIKFQNTIRCHIRFLFEGYYSALGRESLKWSTRFKFVKKSGARLVYEQDLKELFNGTTNIPNKREYCEAEDGGLSGSGRSNEESLFKRWKRRLV